jgi:hypothetical protein
MKSGKSITHAGYGRINAAAGVLLLGLAGSVWADSIVGSDEFVCAAGHVSVCAHDGSCENTSTADMGIPQFLLFNLSNRTMRTTEASGENRTSEISIQVREGGKLLIQGSQGGRAMSASISESSGDAAFAIVLDSVTVSVFAACTPLPIN